jgi:hypothetical protein
VVLPVWMYPIAAATAVLPAPTEMYVVFWSPLHCCIVQDASALDATSSEIEITKAALFMGSSSIQTEVIIETG